MVVAHKYETTEMYTYKMSWNGREKFQSAWGKWQIPDNGYKILSSQVFGDRLYLLLRFGESAAKLVLGSISITRANKKANLPHTLHLDYYTSFSSGTYDSATNKTYWDLPYGTGVAGVVVVPTEGVGAGISIAATV